MDRLHLISVFVAVVDTSGFAGAARKLGISAPAVTRAINELETQLGVRLLTRTTRVVRVTEAGQRYAGDCRRILAELAEADESVSGLHGAPRGRLGITAPVMFGALHVAPIVAEYLQRHPEVSAACWFVDRVVNLVEEGVDVAVRIGELPDSSLHALRVGQVRRVVCAAPAYLQRHGTPQHPDELAAHALIASGGVAPTAEWRFQSEGGEARSLRITPRMTTTVNEAAMVAAEQGLGLAWLLSYQVVDSVREGRLAIVLAEHEPPPLPVHLVHLDGRHATQKVRAFLDLAAQRLRDNPALQ